MNRVIRFALGLVVLGAGATTAQAQNLLVNNYNTGTVLDGLFSNSDDAAVTRNLGGTFSIFGSSFTTFGVSTNGNLNATTNNFIPSGSGTPLPFSIGVGPSILPMGNDQFIRTTIPSHVFEKLGTNFYSVTWENIGQFAEADTVRNTFQAVWFNGPATIGGFNFQAGDIAFDYVAPFVNLSKDGGSVVGLNKDDGVGFSPLPGTTDGVVQDTTSNLLPASDPRFVLFRFNPATGGYTASIQTTSSVPEPATYALTACGLAVVLAGYRRRAARRRSKAKRA